MKTYEYKGFRHDGRSETGLVEAVDTKEAREKLATRGVLAEQLRSASQRSHARLYARHAAFSLEQRSAFYREAGALLKAGIPLAQALEILIDAPELGAMRLELAGIRDKIREGDMLAAALGKLGERVKSFELAAIEVGERSGTLQEVLDRLADFLEEQERIRDKVQTALIYPSIVVILAIIITALILGVMLPRFAQMFQEARIDLPLFTRVVIVGGKIGLYMITGLGILGVFGWIYGRNRLRKDESVRVAVDRSILRLAVIKDAYALIINLRFARTMALLLRGGVSLVEGMDLAGRATGSPWIAEQVRREAETVRHGSSLANALRRIPELSSSLPAWVQAGEASGDLVALLLKASERFQHRWDRMIARVLAALEPALILAIGILVLMLALAILMPILSLNNVLM